MNSFLRRTVPTALLAGGALLAGAGAAGAQVPVPGGLPTDGLPTGGVDSLSGAPAALCDGPLAAVTSSSPLCEVAGNDNVQLGDAGSVVPASDASVEPQGDPRAIVDIQGDEEPEPCDESGDCQKPEEPCDECSPTTEPPTTEPPTTEPPTTEPPTTEPPTTEPPTTQVVSEQPPAEELPRTGSTVAPFVVAGAVLLLLGAALVTFSSKGTALWRRS